MDTEKTPGITLSSKPFGERDKILHVFTFSHGLISVIIKRLSAKKSVLLTAAGHFCESEFIFRRSRTEMVTLQEASILEENLFIRSSLAMIECASSMAMAILKSQIPFKPAPGVYLLLSGYLKKLASFETPHTLAASFYLKLLLHEGLLNLKELDDDMQTLALSRSFDAMRQIKIEAGALPAIKTLFENTI